jgi:hypothetical protein
MEQRQIMDDNRGQMRLGVVWRRVGLTDEALRRWLLRFAEVDFEHVDQATQARLREELSAFLALSRTSEIAGSGSKRARRSLVPGLRQRFGAWPSPSVEHGSAIDEKVALQANRWIRDLLSNLGQDEITRFKPVIEYTLGRVSHPRGWALTYTAEGSDFDLFQLHAYRAFATWTHGLRKCVRCGRIFVPRGRQTFCSQRCAETTRKARWRKAERKRMRAPEKRIATN